MYVYLYIMYIYALSCRLLCYYVLLCLAMLYRCMAKYYKRFFNGFEIKRKMLLVILLAVKFYALCNIFKVIYVWKAIPIDVVIQWKDGV